VIGRAPYLLLIAAFVAACAAEVARTPSVMQPAADGYPRLLELGSPAEVFTGTGYNRVLAAGTRWRLTGSIAQGAVYRASEGVLTLEGANIHEAYLVVRDRDLVGFFLPVEKAYSPLPQAVRLSISNP